MLEILERSGDQPHPTALPSLSRRCNFRFGGLPVLRKDATTMSGPTGGRTSSEGTTWNMFRLGRSSWGGSTERAVLVEGLLLPEPRPSLCCSVVSSSDTKWNDPDFTGLPWSEGPCLSSQSSWDKSSLTSFPGSRLMSLIRERTFPQMSTTTFLFSLV